MIDRDTYRLPWSFHDTSLFALRCVPSDLGSREFYYCSYVEAIVDISLTNF